MNSIISLLGGARGYLLVLLMMVISSHSYSQSCDCPAVDECGECEGGITSLILEYNASSLNLLAAVITVSDEGGVIFTGTVNDGEEFSFTSSAGDGARFIGDKVTITADILSTVEIFTSCSTPIYIGDTYDNYTVTAGISESGYAICCSAETMEKNPPEITGCPADINVTLNDSECAAEVTWDPPTATDDCGIADSTNNHNPGATFDVGTTEVIYTFTDNYGNTAICSFYINIFDQTDPVISECPSTIEVPADTSTCETQVSWIPPIASDNCSAVFTSTHNPEDLFPVGVTKVTYTATDESGNTSTCSFDVIVTDETDPVFTNCPATDIVEAADGSCEAVATWSEITATDNCGIETLTSTHNSGDAFPIGTTTVVYTATDSTGNTSTCSFDVIVTDETDPVFTNCPATDIVKAADGSCEAVAIWSEITATDNCGIETLTSTHNSGDAFPIGTTTVVYTATDSTGNTSTCSFDVIVTDETDPVFTTSCPSDILVITDGSCESAVGWAEPVAKDNCSTVTLTSTHNPGDVFNIGVTTVTYTATDSVGNEISCSFNVEIKEDVAPVIEGCPGNINLNTTPETECGAIANWEEPTVSDNCLVAFTSTHKPGDTFPRGKTTVTYTATDSSGNVTTCSFDVIANDNVKPVFFGCPSSDIVKSAGGSCEVIVTWDDITATDNCDLETITSTHNSGDLFPVGKTKVTYTATDSTGNSANCSFNVVVTETDKPVITGCPSDIVFSTAENSCDTAVFWEEPTATDNCEEIALTSNYSPGDIFGIGPTTVIYSATDDSGNTSTCSFDVIVNDETPPVISGCPSENVVVSADNSCEAVVNWPEITATDNCGDVTLTSNHKSGDPFPVGTTTVTFTATDSTGYSSTCSFDVIVNDEMSPVISGCPSENVVVLADNSCEAVVSWEDITATDCNDFTLTSTHKPGDTFPIGTTTVTYTATDDNGNTSTCSFDVVVDDAAPPVISGCLSENIVVAVDNSCNAVVNWAEVTATDCNEFTLTSNHNPGDTFPYGRTTVTYTATDNLGNMSSCSFDVVVDGKTPPVITGCPNNIIVEIDENQELRVDWATPTAESFCGEVALTGSHEPGDYFPLGTTEVEYQAVDDAGNTATCRFNVVLTYKEIAFDIPKVLTPDGDGVNDEWVLKNIENYKKNKVVIVDRWGSIIFSASGYNNENIIWRGLNSNGLLVPSGTYFYTISVEFASQVIEKRGFIEIVN